MHLVARRFAVAALLAAPAAALVGVAAGSFAILTSGTSPAWAATTLNGTGSSFAAPAVESWVDDVLNCPTT